MRSWAFGLTAVVLTAAAVVVATWCGWAWSHKSLCVPGDSALACRPSAAGFAVAIAVSLFFVIPLASRVFKARTSPPGSPLGLLGLGLAVSGAGGAALFVATNDALAVSNQVTAIIVASFVLVIGPMILIAGVVTALSSRPRA
ncbi:MAG TPA: hypothetical protein VGM91_07945 [Conexibacter sp.]|jgi:hypothetical protein